MASSVLVVPEAGENSNLGDNSLQLSLLFEAVSKGLFFFFFFFFLHSRDDAFLQSLDQSGPSTHE